MLCYIIVYYIATTGIAWGVGLPPASPVDPADPRSLSFRARATLGPDLASDVRAARMRTHAGVRLESL